MPDSQQFKITYHRENDTKMKENFMLIFALMLLLPGCKDDDDNPPGDNETFSEYFTCKINGEEFDPQGTFYCNNVSFYFYQEATAGVPAGSMVISGRDCPTGESVALRFEGINPSLGYLDFSFPTYADTCFPVYRNAYMATDTFVVYYDHLLSEGMDITTFTPRDSITQKLGKIEGTFEFSVANEENDSIIHITDGAFRFEVPNCW